MNQLQNYLCSPSNDVIQDQLLPITELMMSIYRIRPDLHENLNVKYPEGRKGFLNWFIKNGFNETFKGLLPDKNFLNSLDDLGVNIIGYANASLGVGEDARMTALSIKRGGIPVNLFPISLGERDTIFDHSSIQKANDLLYKINIFNLPGMDQFSLIYSHGLQMFNSRYNIGFWPWELELWPEQLKHCLHLNDEIWAISDFTANSIKSKTSTPILTMPQTVEIPTAKRFNLLKYDVDEDSFKFLFVFDFNSSVSRKNPFALISAFQKAFPIGKNENVNLILKTTWADNTAPYWQKLQTILSLDSRIKVINEVLTKVDTISLMNSIDCFVSLHRSEGFGRCIAESMLLNKPCIVTAYSGNMDYCTKENSLLVDFKRVQVQPHEYPFVGSETNYWADPSIDHASHLMKKIFNSPILLKELSKNARHTIQNKYSVEKTSTKYNERLREIKDKLT